MHMLIIQGSREDGFICADPYLNKGEVFLNDTDFCSSKKQLITIKFLGCNKVNDRDVVVNSLHNLIQKKSNGNVFDMMREFSRDLRENKALLDAEMNTNELAFISIVRKINYLCYGRLSYKKFLEGVMKESGNKQYEQYVEKIEILGRRWSILANRMVKYKLQGYPQSVFLGICDEMLDIAEEENNIAVKLMGEI